MEIVKPTLRILAHADAKGAQIGSAVGLALVAPHALYKGNAPTLKGAACMAGSGMVVGAGLVIVRTVVKLVQMDKDEIKELAAEVKPSKVDKACAIAGGAGLAYGLNRLACMTKDGDSSFACVLFSKRGGWTLLAYSALGVGVCFGAYAVVTGGKAAVCKIKEGVEAAKADCDADESAPLAAAVENGEAAAAAAPDAAADAAEAVETAVAEAVDDATSK